jgi:hypothetical protein
MATGSSLCALRQLGGSQDFDRAAFVNRYLKLNWPRTNCMTQRLMQREVIPMLRRCSLTVLNRRNLGPRLRPAASRKS